MKTKKFLSLVLVGIMMLSMATTSFAAEVTSNGGTGETVVTYGMDEGFTVTIPTNFTIDSTKKATANVSASNVMIAHGKVLEVAVSGDDYDVTGSWELVDEAEASNTLTYTIGTTEGSSDITNGSIVLDVEAGEAYGSTVTETMYFTVIDELSKSGTYTDTLTFTVEVVDSSVVQGDGQTFNPEEPTALVFRSQQPINEFQEVLVNGSTVNENNYTVTEGSTIVTLKEEYLETLDAGNYTIQFVFTNATTSATFKVKAETFDFYIDGVRYEAEAYMTWNDWVNSEYNEEGWSIGYNPDYQALYVAKGDRAIGYTEYDFATGGISEGYNYTSSSIIISFTIAGDSYQAEDGMTWEKWVQSDYNGGVYYINGQNLVTHGNQMLIVKGINIYDRIVNNQAYLHDNNPCYTINGTTC